ncbi:hypothetical protein KFK09_002288 [Dendrobium nobile]|uniref:Alpha-1,4 glucan phosphorylase n=1 Tax=Dendrobium nobile TaxID=94219 RepID=A0A8T3C7D6_DENNO|nr:hypothetical protein KFK09_002288 [Dendrobium nobile]
MDCGRRSAVDEDRSRKTRLAADDDRRQGRWAVDDARSRIAFYQAQSKESLDQVDRNLDRIRENLRAIRKMRMSSATIPRYSSSSISSSASRRRHQSRHSPAVVDEYAPLELPLRWRDPPPQTSASSVSPPFSATSSDSVLLQSRSARIRPVALKGPATESGPLLAAWTSACNTCTPYLHESDASAHLTGLIPAPLHPLLQRAQTEPYSTSKDNESTLVCLSKELPALAHPCAELPSEITSNIVYHAQYSPHFSPLKFDPEQAFYATTLSVCDNLIQRWNDTYLHFYKPDPKQTYYLYMEYLQVRALTNAIGNLDIQGAYVDALKKLGHEIEEIAEKKKDAALGNGGLSRLASCFLDSMATLNLPAWGYGLRYRYDLFKQKISKEGQEEVAEDWLEKFSPWDVVRHDVIFSVRFFGHVEISSTGSRKWVGGEVLQALAYDIPIPGYKTKNAISLRLWDAKARAEDFNLFQFNDGQYESAALLHSKAQQICAVLYPGDTTENGKILRLKQQFFLCSASLQDIIARFKERKDGKGPYQWSEFSNKVAVQLNDNIEVTIVKISYLDSTENVYPTPCLQTARYNVNEGFDPRLIRHCIVNDMGVGEDKWEQFLAVVKSKYDGELNDKRSIEYSGINPDSYSCNQLLEGLCKAKQNERACKLFANMMEKEELEPNDITFVSVLRGCCVAGLVDKGLEYFDLMNSKYGIEPWPEQYGCMVDLYGRDGRLEEATLQEENIENKVFDPGICLLQQSLFH